MRYSLIAVFFLMLAFSAQPARAQDASSFTVSGIKADATAASAVDARQLAFDKAQQDAFTALASRFLTEDQMKTFQPPPALEITTLVDDFEITQEQLSAVRYVGTYTFRFKPAATRAWFGAKSAAMPPVAAQQPTTPPAMTETAPSFQAAILAAPSSMMRAHVRFAGLPQWIGIERAIQRTPGVIGTSLSSLKQGEAFIDIKYQGSPDILRQSFIQSGLSFREGANGAYASSEPAGAVYEIGMDAMPSNGSQYQ